MVPNMVLVPDVVVLVPDIAVVTLGGIVPCKPVPVELHCGMLKGPGGPSGDE